MTSKTKIQRFFEKVEITEGCWAWKASTNRNGYGSFWHDGRSVVAHKFLYELIFGKVGLGLQLDHLCRNRICVNPYHLEQVTCRENLMRGNTMAAINIGKTHCLRGHPYSNENTKRYRGNNGHRQCYACQRERQKRMRESRRHGESKAKGI